MYIIINTSNKEKMQLALLSSKGEVLLLQNIKSEYQQSEKLLPAIENIFKKTKTKKENLKGILAVKGPGGFTSLRIGISTANALAFALDIPVMGIDQIDLVKSENYLKLLSKIKKKKNFKEVVLPEYGAEPNIG